MKKAMALLLAASLVLPACPVWAATESYISNLASVKEETEFTADTAPVLGLRASEDHRGVFTFMLTLEKAEWTYGAAGEISTGVTYRKITDSMLAVTVDTDTANATQEQIRIPLLCRLTEAGGAVVTIDPLDSTVSAASYTFAQSGMEYGGLTYSVDGSTSFVDETELTAVTIRDDNSDVILAGEVYRLRLGNGCVFTGAGTLTALGKYEERVRVKIQDDNQSVLRIEILADTPARTGVLVLSGLRIAATENTAYGNVPLLLTRKDGTAEIAVAKKVKQEVRPESPVKQTLTLQLGQAAYKLDGTAYAIPVAPFADENGRALLPLRALANALGIADSDISWDDGKKQATLKQGDTTIVATVGSRELLVNGQAVTMDTQAVIRQNYTFLPLRAILNALGVADADIAWDEETKTVTVKR